MTQLPLPRLDEQTAWPSSPGSPVPAIARLPFEGAPAVIAERTPYPFCGAFGEAGPKAQDDCFLSAVLEGRPAEVVEHGFGVEGGEITTIYRFDGKGAIWAYSEINGQWQAAAGDLTLNPGGGWSWSGWYGTGGEL